MVLPQVEVVVSPARKHGMKQGCERLFHVCRRRARGTRSAKPWPGPSSSFAKRSVGRAGLRSGGRRQDKAARGKRLGCACRMHSSARLAAHLPSDRTAGGGRAMSSAAAASLSPAKQLRNNQFTKPLFIPQASLPTTCSPRKAMRHMPECRHRACVSCASYVECLKSRF